MDHAGPDRGVILGGWDGPGISGCVDGNGPKGAGIGMCGSNGVKPGGLREKWGGII